MLFLLSSSYEYELTYWFYDTETDSIAKKSRGEE
jgi:hypothetical protein